MVSSESLRFEYLSDRDASRLYESLPELRKAPYEYCPTCSKKGHYTWRGETIECDCEMQTQLYKHYLRAGIGRTYQRLDWDDYSGDETAAGVCMKYVLNSERLIDRGTGLILTGQFGVGKTFCMNLLLKDLVKLGYDCFGTTFSSMIQMFTAGWKDEESRKHFERRVAKSQVLLLDDLGKEMTTSTNLSGSTLDDVIRSRVQEGRVTLLTANLSFDEIGEKYGEAVLSLLTEFCIVHEVEGEDFRPKAGRRLLEEALGEETRPIV